MLRIHFTARDIAKLRVAPGPDPLWEVLLSLHVLPTRDGGRVFGDWRKQVRPRLDPSVRMLLRLAPPLGYSPDFLTPGGGVDGLSHQLDLVRSTPRRRLATDLALLARGRRPTQWARDLAAADQHALRRLTDALDRYFHVALAPSWDRIVAQVDADRAVRSRTVLNGGFQRVLATLGPGARWDGSVLWIRSSDHREVHLDGRGLLLVPSYFCWGGPVTLRDAELSPTLVYPIEHAPEPVRSPASTVDHPLSALLGRTRAAVLEVVAGGCTTGELARRLNVSPATASEHGTVLRDAGLIVSRRHRNSVHHTLTPLGRAVLAAGGGAAARPA